MILSPGRSEAVSLPGWCTFDVFQVHSSGVLRRRAFAVSAAGVVDVVSLWSMILGSRRERDYLSGALVRPPESSNHAGQSSRLAFRSE